MRPNGHLDGTGTTLKLDVAIVGAGVGGLSAAIALSRSGHRVIVYESALELSEVSLICSESSNMRRWISQRQ